MMALGQFVGVPDWRSVTLALAFALLWIVPLGRGWLRSRWFWLAAAIAAALFPFSIAWVQVPAQQALNAMWTGILEMQTIRQYLPLVASPSLAVASAVQESVKLLVAIMALRGLGQSRNPSAGVALGAAAGAGYGAFEAFWVFNLVFGSGWSWAAVQLGGIQALLAFIERFVTVPFHIGSAALAGYGFATGRPWRFWLLAVALHTVANYSTIAVQAGLIDYVSVEVWVAAVAVVTIGFALWLRQSLLHGAASG